MAKGSKLFRLTAAASVALILTGSFAEARSGGGRSSGSRGSHTSSAPPPTNTAPSMGQPMQRSATPAPAQQPGGMMGQRPAGSGFGLGNIAKGFAVGLLGAGLIGMLTGNGFMSGIGSFFGFLGFIIQGILLFLVVRWVYNRFIRRREQPALAGVNRQAMPSGLGPMGAGLGGAAGGAGYAGVSQGGDTIGLTGADFDSFERLLSNIQDAYSREDLNALRALATPEMVSYFADDLGTNQRKGVINRVSDVKLLQGDLSESWREDGTDYATVAMRFSLVDQYIDRASGRVVDGSPQPQQVTEIWTFRRDHGRSWILSAIQQVS